MTATIPADMVERFRAAIVDRLGLQFDAGKLKQLTDVLQRRARAAGCDAEAYVSSLETKAAREEIGVLASHLTIPETYFFRNIDQFRAFTHVVIPQRASANAAAKRLRILSLGCASGEEPYTLAMLARDVLSDTGWEFSILGVDVNPAAIERARRGRFSAWTLRETPERDRQRWFRAEGRDYALDESLRASVRFEQRNLVDDDCRLWAPEQFDVIFCRNVIMYFSPEQARALIARVAQALCADGYLFLGHAETLRGISTDFHLLHTHGTFYYQKKGRIAYAPPPEEPADKAALAMLATDADSWVDAIRRASERVTALTDSHDRTIGRTAHKAGAASSYDLGVALELLRNERFAEALAIVDALPAESSKDADVLLLRATLLAHGGQLGEAEAACTRLLELDELNAGAHYLLALCREGAGDHMAARHHDQVATYLEPGFAMPRLHLGLLERRAGQRESARRELSQALVLLQREDASRVLLFGGGFSRETLITLCQAELTRCGGDR
jgi:chemotaxis protein methyltransferase CheR